MNTYNLKSTPTHHYTPALSPQTSGSTHLDVAAPGDLHKLLLFLQRLVHLVVGHAEHAEAPLLW